MTSQPSSISSLKKFVARHPSSAELSKIVTALITEPNERSVALGMGAILEGALKLAIIPKIIIPEKEGENDLFGHQAPLRAFSAKIKMGFALGIYGPKTRADLDAIREVRNAFAHSMIPVEFETTLVANVCDRITLPERANLTADLDMEWIEAKARYVLSAGWFTGLFDNMGKTSTWAESKGDEEPVVLALFDGLNRAIVE